MFLWLFFLAFLENGRRQANPVHPSARYACCVFHYLSVSIPESSEKNQPTARVHQQAFRCIFQQCQDRIYQEAKEDAVCLARNVGQRPCSRTTRCRHWRAARDQSAARYLRFELSLSLVSQKVEDYGARAAPLLLQPSWPRCDTQSRFSAPAVGTLHEVPHMAGRC